MIILHEFGNSVCCQKVRVTLAEKGLAWSSVQVNLFKNEQYAPAYLKLNPSGVVPTLIHDKDVVIESTLICEYLNDLYPEPPLMPTGARARTHVRRWSKMVDEGLHEGVAEISFSAMFRERMKALSKEELRLRLDNIGDPRRRDRFTSTFEKGVHSPFVLYGIAAYERAFEKLEAALGDGGPWIMGAEPTLADIALMPYVARLSYMGLLDLWTAERPKTCAWWERVQAWASFQAGIARPMLPQEMEQMALLGPTIRPELGEIISQLRR